MSQDPNRFHDTGRTKSRGRDTVPLPDHPLLGVTLPGQLFPIVWAEIRFNRTNELICFFTADNKVLIDDEIEDYRPYWPKSRMIGHRRRKLLRECANVG